MAGPGEVSKTMIAMRTIIGLKIPKATVARSESIARFTSSAISRELNACRVIFASIAIIQLFTH
jgi:hypothetical protein